MKLWEKTVSADADASNAIGIDTTNENNGDDNSNSRDSTVLEWLTSYTEQLEIIVKEQV